METIVVEAVTNKYANKFNSGSVLTGGKWLQVAKNLDLSLFQKDQQITVETKTNDKGYTSIVGVGGTSTAMIESPKATKRTYTRKTTTVNTGEKNGSVIVNNYETDKNKRIQVQGILQAVVQSPATINFGDDVNGIASKVLELTDLLIAGMEERV